MSDRSGDALVKILRNVRGAFAEGPVDRIEVRHLHADGTETRATGVSGDKISGKGVTPEGIADEIMDGIREDSTMFAGVAKYVVLFYKPGEREYSRRFAVELRGKADRLSDAIETSEPASEKGLVAMTMRHMETMMARMNTFQEMTLRHFGTEHERLSRENERLGAQHIQVLQLGEDLLDRRAERDLRIKREVKQDKIVERGIEQVMMLGGPLLKKLLPGPAGQAVATDAMVISLMASLRPEQIEAMMQMMSPEQRANFIELYGALRERYEKVKLEKNEGGDAANGSPPTTQENETQTQDTKPNGEGS